MKTDPSAVTDAKEESEQMSVIRQRIHKLWISGSKWQRVWNAIHEELLAAQDRGKYQEIER